jgi:hypothetical protein
MPLPRKQHVYINAAGEGSGGSAARPEPDNFSREYVKELREESARYRTRAQDAESKVKEAEERAAQVAARLTEAETRAKTNDERLLMAELHVAAARAGMVDLDGLKLADLTTVKLNEAGEVEGAAELMEALKREKPYLFRAQAAISTSSTKAPPPKEKPQAKTASEMNSAEWAAKKKELGLS